MPYSIGMPELPEVHTVVTELNKKLKNLKIIRVEVRLGKVISHGPATVSNLRDVTQEQVLKFSSILKNQKFTSVTRRGKMLIFNLSGKYTLLAHLKMTGQFIFEDAVQREKTKGEYRILNSLKAPLVKLPMKHTHVIFHLSDNSTLYYNDIRQFGYLRLVEDGDLDKVKEFIEYGPEPLSSKFTLEIFKENLKNRKKIPIKLALMETKIVVGIGNIYSDEILYLAKIRPDRTVESLKHKELEAVYAQIKPVLEAGIKYKGSSVGDFIRTDGKWGTMGKYHQIYGKKKQICPGCEKVEVATMKLGGRTACYCPHEQK
jgi:formamidopyrimidine-DNA glycosylase